MTEDEGFSTEVAREEGRIVVHVTGVLDMETCERLRDIIESHLAPQQAIALDLAGVEFMDSSSLRYLVHARSTLTEDGGSLVLRNPSEAAHRLLSVAGVEHLLHTDAVDHPPDP